MWEAESENVLVSHIYINALSVPAWLIFLNDQKNLSSSLAGLTNLFEF